MKKVVIFLVLLSCSTNDDVQIQTEPTTIPTNTTVFTAMDPEVAFANFVDYWNKNLKSYRPLSNDELKTTNDLIWPDSIIVNDSITCNLRVKGTLTTGLADENHPVEFDSFQNVQWWLTESYVCNDDLITNLYGPPFFQDDEWWIFAATNYPENLGTDSLYKECGYPCSPVAAVRFATRVSIDVSEDPITTTTSMMTLEEYEKGWIEKLEIYPVLTKDEFDKSIEFLLSYQILKENFPFTELEIIVDSKNYVCERKTTGTIITAYANERHPLSLYISETGDDENADELRIYEYIVTGDYNCSLENSEEGLFLWGPLFFQDNQWWGFIEYEDDYWEQSGEPDVLIRSFVKRISLGISIND